MKSITILMPFMVIIGARSGGVAPKSPAPESHYNCRNNYYGGTNGAISRFPVPDDKVRWEIKWPQYNPIMFTDTYQNVSTIIEPDTDETRKKIRFHTIDENGINRISHLGNYTIQNSYPLNPVGRTGLSGRGILPRWGPNHMVLALVTRLKPQKDVINMGTPIAQFLGVLYHQENTTFLGFLGGFVCSAESKKTALTKQQYLKSIENSVKLSSSDKEFLDDLLDIDSKVGMPIGYGYHDQPTNTDNAWMECTIIYAHDLGNSRFTQIPEGYPCKIMEPRWVDINRKVSSIPLVNETLRAIANYLKCQW